MKFRLIESIEEKEKYQGWAQEDIDLFESIDWDIQGEDDFDAGFAYLDSAVLYDKNDEILRIETEFHKFFKNNPYVTPYYMPIEKRPFTNVDDYIGPIGDGLVHRNYQVYNKYDSKKS